MRTTSRFSFVCSLLVLFVVSDGAQALFFQAPKRAIWNLLESLGGLKKAPPSIHHYHMHYYPVPISLPKHSAQHAPKIEIDLSSLHSHEPVRSYGGGWPSQQEPEFVLPSEASAGGWPQPEAWPDNSFQQKSSPWAWDSNELLEKDQAAHTDSKSGLLLQVPLHQQIVLYQPPAKDKSSLLQTLFKKIRRINDAIFHPEEEEEVQGLHCHGAHHDDKPYVHNSLSYALR